MLFTITSFAVFLSLLWFLVYWILGGVFFAVIALLRLGRVRKLRFSCLFSLWAIVIGIGAAFKGLEYSQQAISVCLNEATDRSKMISAIFGCGFTGVMGAFAIGVIIMIIGGFIIFAISKTKTKPWINIETQSDDESGQTEETQEEVQSEIVESHESKFF